MYWYNESDNTMRIYVWFCKSSYVWNKENILNLFFGASWLSFVLLLAISNSFSHLFFTTRILKFFFLRLLFVRLFLNTVVKLRKKNKKNSSKMSKSNIEQWFFLENSFIDWQRTQKVIKWQGTKIPSLKKERKKEDNKQKNIWDMIICLIF